MAIARLRGLAMIPRYSLGLRALALHPRLYAVARFRGLRVFRPNFTGDKIG